MRWSIEITKYYLNQSKEQKKNYFSNVIPEYKNNIENNARNNQKIYPRENLLGKDTFTNSELITKIVKGTLMQI